VKGKKATKQVAEGREKYHTERPKFATNPVGGKNVRGKGGKSLWKEKKEKKGTKPRSEYRVTVEERQNNNKKKRGKEGMLYERRVLGGKKRCCPRKKSLEKTPPVT